MQKKKAFAAPHAYPNELRDTVMLLLPTLHQGIKRPKISKAKGKPVPGGSPPPSTAACVVNQAPSELEQVRLRRC